MLEPKEIVVSDNEHTAWFDYRSGIKYADNKNLKQCGDFRKVHEFTHFLVCCGDVAIAVRSEDFPNIERRAL